MYYNTGRYEEQIDGYTAFIPACLPYSPDIQYDDTLHLLLSEADRALSGLDVMVDMLPNPDHFIWMLARKEALQSAQIEGTIATFYGILAYEADVSFNDDPNQIREVTNYMQALQTGFERVKNEPITLSLLCDLHRILLTKVRGAKALPGMIRPIQNQIGGDPLYDARYIPPPQENVRFLLNNLEKFIAEEKTIPPLIVSALIHGQFEMIHPFLDGNGRIGRLLISLYLCWREIIANPTLNLSYYLKRNRSVYYERLSALEKNGDLEGWMKFFLQGVIEVSNDSHHLVKKTITLERELVKRVIYENIGGIHGARMIELLFMKTMVTSADISSHCGVSIQTANTLVRKFEEAGIVKEVTGWKRNRKYLYTDYVKLIAEGTSP